VRLNCPNVDEFVQRFAVNVTRTGMFVPSREPHPVGSTIQFEFVLVDGQIALSGEGTVTWVREFDPAETTRPHGMGIKFTTVAEASRPVLERILEQRKAAKQKQRPAENPAVHQAPSEPRIAGSEPNAPATTTSATAEPNRTSPAEATRSESTGPVAPRRSNRGGLVLAWMAAAVGASVLAAALLTRDTIRDVPRQETGVSPALAVFEPLRPRIGQANEPAAQLVAATAPPPPQPAVQESPPERAEAKKPVARTRRSPVQIESILTGPTYERHTCPGPTGQFSLKSHRRVNVCIRIAAMHEPVTADLTVVWERNGATVCRTTLPISGRHVSSRTRAHIAINERRTGRWSVSIQTSEGDELARSSFQVDP
jgi:uncharacterized protein (TIGR02266 family)